MSKKSKILVGIIVGVVAIVAVVAAINLGGEDNNKKGNDESEFIDSAVVKTLTPQNNGGEDNTPATQKPKVTPTFMYFVAKSDPEYDTAISVAKELEAQYGDKVKFEVLDVDENPELKQKYSINQEGVTFMQTPTLIMLDVDNDISFIGESKVTDKETLKGAIDKALNK